MGPRSGQDRVSGRSTSTEAGTTVTHAVSAERTERLVVFREWQKGGSAPSCWYCPKWKRQGPIKTLDLRVNLGEQARRIDGARVPGDRSRLLDHFREPSRRACLRMVGHLAWSLHPCDRRK